MILIKISKLLKKHMISPAILIAMTAICCSKITTASDELTGIWASSDIRYENTYFEIKKREITFGTKNGDSDSYTILEIKKKPMQDDNWVQYTIFYQNRDLQKVEFPFYFQSSDRGVIRFMNQSSLVWKKEKDSL
jgi:hypothetical protein